LFPQHLSKRRDLDAQIDLIDYHVWPYAPHQLALRDHGSRALDKHNKQVKGATANNDSCAIALEAPLSRHQTKPSEKNRVIGSQNNLLHIPCARMPSSSRHSGLRPAAISHQAKCKPAPSQAVAPRTAARWFLYGTNQYTHQMDIHVEHNAARCLLARIRVGDWC
jgi:hypothetical protein